MRELLIDSHQLIWILFEPERISRQTRRVLTEADVIYVSLASIWELALKHNKGKLAYSPKELLEGVKVLSAQLLYIEPAHVLMLERIKTVHQDPFDRLLLAQAAEDDLMFLTADKELLKLDLGNVIDARK